MYLRLVRLTRYKRLMLANIQSLEWTPTKNLMLIIGSNGSGKSSLLAELSPLPSHHSQFEKGGSKTVHCSYKGSTYELNSVYDKGTGHHSFIRDGVELNEGRTYQIQLDLVNQEFNGLDDEIQDMLTGRTKFTQLPVNKRREWLTRMSPVDLSFAFHLLARINEAGKAQKNVVDHLTKRLSNENIDMLDASEITRLSQERSRLTDRVNELFKHRNPATKQAWAHNGAAREELDAIMQSAKSLLREYPRLTDTMRVRNEGEFSRIANDRLAKIQASQAVIDRLIEELEMVKATTPDQVEKVSPEDVQELRDRLNEHKDCIRRAKSVCENYQGIYPLSPVGVFGDPRAKLEDAFNRAYEIILTIPENETGGFSTLNAREHRDQLTAAKTKLRSIEEFIASTMRRIATLKGCEHVQCTNCSHTFVPGVDPLDIPRLEEKLRNATAAESTVSAEIKRIEEYLERFTEYAGFVNTFQQIARDHKDLELVWSALISEGGLYRNPRLAATGFVAWHSAQAALVEVEINLEHAKRIEARLQAIEAMDFDAAGFMQQRASKLEAEIHEMLIAQEAVRAQAEAYVRSGTEIQQYVINVTKLIRSYEKWRERSIAHAEWLMDQAFSNEIDATHLQLATVGNQLREAERRDTEIKLLEETVDDASDAYKDFQLLAKAMSPKGGLIGQYLFGFLQGVTQLVNTVIDEVWTYPMEVLPSKMDREDLDYKFPLRVQSGAVEAADIALGSDSQCEIVNFAFRIAKMKFMGFDDFPLYLDEFGRTFDEQHRTNLVPFISRLIELGQFQQIFYISHDLTTYGGFNQAEVVVLDPKNVTVPEAYNKNLVLI